MSLRKKYLLERMAKIRKEKKDLKEWGESDETLELLKTINKKRDKTGMLDEIPDEWK